MTRESDGTAMLGVCIIALISTAIGIIIGGLLI